MEKKYDRSIQGENQGTQKRGSQGGGYQGGQRQEAPISQRTGNQPNVERKGNYEKGPDQWKRQSEPAQQGGERKR